MMFRFLTIFVVIAFFPISTYADSDMLAVEIASDHIDVTVGFNGSSIELFGDRRDSNAHIAIVVEGPRKAVTIWQKSRVMGAWVNRHYTRFDKFPVYYHHASSLPDEGVEGLNAVLLENGIGHKGLLHKQKDKVKSSNKKENEFYKALIIKNIKAGVFFDKPAEITFLNDNFFRASFSIPPSAPTGEYKIHSYMIDNKGKVIEKTLDMLKVEQVGLNAFVFKSARDYSLIYALLCISLAMFSGWLVSVLRVRP